MDRNTTRYSVLAWHVTVKMNFYFSELLKSEWSISVGWVTRLVIDATELKVIGTSHLSVHSWSLLCCSSLTVLSALASNSHPQTSTKLTLRCWLWQVASALGNKCWLACIQGLLSHPPVQLSSQNPVRSDLSPVAVAFRWRLAILIAITVEHCETKHQRSRSRDQLDNDCWQIDFVTFVPLDRPFLMTLCFVGDKSCNFP